MIIIMIALYSLCFSVDEVKDGGYTQGTLLASPPYALTHSPFCPRHMHKAKNTETRKTVTTTTDGRRVVVSCQFVFNLGQPFG